MDKIDESEYWNRDLNLEIRKVPDGLEIHLKGSDGVDERWDIITLDNILQVSHNNVVLASGVEREELFNMAIDIVVQDVRKPLEDMVRLIRNEKLSPYRKEFEG